MRKLICLKIIYLDENIKEYDNKINECKLKNRYFNNK